VREGDVIDQTALGTAMFDDAGMARRAATPQIEGVQIIAAKAGDTIAVM
jgi:hypothetical protein